MLLSSQYMAATCSDNNPANIARNATAIITYTRSSSCINAKSAFDDIITTCTDNIFSDKKKDVS